MFVELMFFRFGLLYWLGSAAFGYFLVSYLNQYVTAATHFSFFWTIWWVNRLLYPSTRVIYYLYCSYRQRPLTVQLKMEYSIIPLVHLSLELQPLLQLASSDVNLTCGVINKFSIRSFNSWVPLGLGLWLKFFFFFWTFNPRRGTPPAGVTLGWATIVCSHLKRVNTAQFRWEWLGHGPSWGVLTYWESTLNI